MLGTQIAALRRQAGMTQKELAQRIHVDPGTIGNYERNLRQPSLATLTALAQALGVCVDDLLVTQSAATSPTTELTHVILGRRGP